MKFAVVEESCPFQFQQRVNNLVAEGYEITDTYCHVVDRTLKYVCFLYREKT